MYSGSHRAICLISFIFYFLQNLFFEGLVRFVFSTRLDSTGVRTIRICTRPDFCGLFFSIDFKSKSLVDHSTYRSYVLLCNFFFLSLFVSFF